MSLRSPIVKRVTLIVLRLVWLAACLTALVGSDMEYQGRSDWKTEENLAFEMVVLSFPASCLVAAGLMLTGAALGLIGLGLPPSSKVEMTSTWLLFFVAGYVQWFVLVPKLLRLRRKIRDPRAKDTSP
jgi:hypothetical protein